MPNVYCENNVNKVFYVSSDSGVSSLYNSTSPNQLFKNQNQNYVMKHYENNNNTEMMDVEQNVVVNRNVADISIFLILIIILIIKL